ncbi:MAG: type II toxin-antitoxin system PemK/MazF family toxin [Candidatus Melainabacteria bacterium]|nr:type II toxin-antitoxin system PemK/MazF family toxin [Candidatus Melainabacteria bacterium]
MINHSAKKPKRGEIWVVNLDPTLGKEIKKTRPCLVMQSDLINEVLRTTMVAPITSTVKENWPFAVTFEKGEGGLKNKSMALFNQIKTTDIIRFIKKLGKISDEKIKEAEDALLLSFQVKR